MNSQQHFHESSCFNCTYFRVATGQGKVREILFFFKIREKSGNFAKWLGKFKIPRKLGRSGNLLILAKNCSAVAGI